MNDNDGRNFSEESVAHLSRIVAEQKVKEIKAIRLRTDNFLDIAFESGLTVHIRYDYIYGWWLESEDY